MMNLRSGYANPTGEFFQIRLRQNKITKWQHYYVAGAAADFLLLGRYREHAYGVDRYNHKKLEARWESIRVDGWEFDLKSASTLIAPEPIEKIAKELKRRKKLSGDDIYAILDREPPWYSEECN
jgi:hypothetical protein